MSVTKSERPEWNSLQRLIQDLISGVSRRHTFTQWEVDFLFDLQNCRLRKASKETVLRKYLRVVHQYHIEGADEPPRLSLFLANQLPPRTAVSGS